VTTTTVRASRSPAATLHTTTLGGSPRADRWNVLVQVKEVVRIGAEMRLRRVAARRSAMRVAKVVLPLELRPSIATTRGRSVVRCARWEKLARLCSGDEQRQLQVRGVRTPDTSGIRFGSASGNEPKTNPRRIPKKSVQVGLVP
jgi:hypothetical protein